MRLHAQRGQALPFAAICFTVLLGFAALGVDVGYLRYQQRMEQAAADAASLAGASELAVGSSTFATAAKNEAAKNGFTDGASGVTVTVNNPPASGPSAGKSSAVEVIISVDHPTFFSGVLGKTSNNVTTRAVSSVIGDKRACYYALTGAATIGGTNVTSPNCGLISNNGFTSNGSNIDLSSIDVNGPIAVHGGTLTHQPRPSVPAADPCQTIAGCRYLANNPPSTSPCQYNGGHFSGQNLTFYPGVYCSTLDFSGCTVTLQPGVYVLPGIKAAGTTITQVSNTPGDGVTLYITNGSVDLTGASGAINAPTTGNNAGVSIYQGPSNSNQAKIAGSTFGPAGLLYFPTADVKINGTNGTQQLIITGSLTIGGSNNTDPGFTTQNALIRTAVLSE